MTVLLTGFDFQTTKVKEIHGKVCQRAFVCFHIETFDWRDKAISNSISKSKTKIFDRIPYRYKPCSMHIFFVPEKCMRSQVINL